MEYHDMNRIVYLFKTTLEEFIHDNAAQMAAALAYYGLFAIPSILLISLNILSVFLQDTQAQSMLISQTEKITDGSTTEMLKFIIGHLHQYSAQGNIAQWIGIIVLIFTSAGAFRHLQVSLNTIWDIAPPPKRSMIVILKKRLTALLFIFGIGLLILISFISNALLSKIGVYVSNPIGISPLFLQVINVLAPFLGTTLFISLIYKLLPEGNMAWKDIFVGAFVSALLFLLGKYIIGLIITNNSFSSIYGAAGSLLILLVWMYYLSLIFFFGAEFTQVYANLHGKGIALGKGMVSVKDHARMKKHGKKLEVQ